MRLSTSLMINLNEGLSMEITARLPTNINSKNNLKNQYKHLFHTNRFEKFIYVLHAIFEGIGYAGIVTAAFWYATAPIAPEGFKGPISTFTIVITTICSLVLAIPIACCTYKKIVNDVIKKNEALLINCDQLNELSGEVTFELLKLRALCGSDFDFLTHCKSIKTCENIETICHHSCLAFASIKNKYIFIDVEGNLNFAIHEVSQDKNSILVHELLKQNTYTHLKSVRKLVLTFIKNYITHTDLGYKTLPQKQPIKHVGSSFVSAVIYVEVLLSICWTVASILIGIKVIDPITTHQWLFFGFLCLAAGPLFGVGIYFNKVIEHYREKLNHQINYNIKKMNDQLEAIHTLITKKILTHKKHRVTRNIDLSVKKINHSVP